jgi:hypothetical protein
VEKKLKKDTKEEKPIKNKKKNRSVLIEDGTLAAFGIAQEPIKEK